jgi:hypothetical protein
MRRLPLIGLLLALALALVPATAAADSIVGLPIAPPKSLKVAPPGFATSGYQAMAIAKRQPAIARALRDHPDAGLDVEVYNNIYWQIQVAEVPSGDIPASVDIWSNGDVLGVYSGVAASSYLARPHFFRNFSNPWVWLTFGILFLVPFVDLRRLRRLLHLDLLVVLSFGVSYAIVDRGGHAELGILLIYPPLLYLLGRMLFVGLRPRRPQGRLVPHLPTAALVIGVVALCGARVDLNVHSSRVMDVGFASVAGADRLAHRQPLYVDNSTHGDTYGPVNYLAYIPFEAAFPFRGGYDTLQSAHAAAIFFDVLTIIGLVLLGMRFRAGPEGRRLGLAMAWAFAACPFTLLTLMTNTNDGLVGLLLVGTLLALSSAPARGLLLGLATAAKFSPGALLLIFARGRTGDGRRQWLQTAGACLGLFVFTMAVYFPKTGGLHALWNCTLGYQLGRDPDFSFWAVFPHVGWTQQLMQLVAVAVIGVTGFARGRRGLGEISALAAAVLIAVQLPGGHWFYFYISWFMPLVLAALFTRQLAPLAAEAADPAQDDGDVVALPAPPQLRLAG